VLVLDTPQAAAREPGLVLEAAPEAGGQAVFNPFSTVGTVVREPAPLPPEPQGGDWALPLLAMFLGIALIAWLLRKMMQ
jgi:hypothetical protein